MKKEKKELISMPQSKEVLTRTQNLIKITKHILDNSTMKSEISASQMKIKIVGVGSSGINLIKHMKNSEVENVDLIAISRSQTELNKSNIPFNLHVEPKIRGLGGPYLAGQCQEYASENFEAVKKILNGADIVIVLSALGGCTSGLIPMILQVAEEIDAFATAIVTTPFRYEGRKRTKEANMILMDIVHISTAVVLPCEPLLALYPDINSTKELFKVVDDFLLQVIGVFLKIILPPRENLINNNLDKVKKIMCSGDLACIGTGYSVDSENAALKATEEAIKFPLYNQISLNDSTGLLVHFYCSSNYSTKKINETMDTIKKVINKNLPILFITTSDDTLNIEEVKVIIIATGFSKEVVLSSDSSIQPTK